MNRRSGWSIMMQLIGLVKPLRAVMAAAVAAGTAGALCATAVPVLGAAAAASLWGFPLPGGTTIVLAAVAVAAVLRAVLHYAEQLCNHYIAFKLLALIRHRLFEALRRLAPAKLEGRDKGNLIALMTGDIELLEVFYAHTVSPVMIALLTSGAMTLFFAFLHPVLGVTMAAAYLTVGFLLPFFSSRFGKEAGMSYRHLFGEMNSFFLDSLWGMKEVLQYRCGADRIGQLRSDSRRLSGAFGRLKSHEGLVGGFGGAAVLLFTGLVTAVSFFLYSRGAIAFAVIPVAVTAAASSFGPVLALSALSNNLLQTLAAGERVLSLLEEEPSVADVTDGAVPGAFSGAAFSDVTFGYGEETVLRDFSLTVPPGKILGIRGKSGCGKSTLLKLLMRFWEADRGVVSLSGNDVRRIRTDALRDSESYVTQETALFGGTIENNVKIGAFEATREEVEEACRKASVHDFIVSLPDGYDTVIGEFGETLSGGERQRIGVARSFLRPAPLLLLDEPTANLDSLNEAVVLHSIREHRGERTVILVSHRRSTLGIADSVYEMDNISADKKEIQSEKEFLTH